MSSRASLGRVSALLALAAVSIVAVGCSAFLQGLTDVTTATPTPAPIRLSFEVLPRGAGVVDAAAVASTRDIVKRRLLAAGIVSPMVTVEGTQRILVDVPVTTANLSAVTDLISAPGVLTFVPLPAETYGTSTTAAGPEGVVAGQPLPDDPALVPLFSGEHLTAASPGTDAQTGQPVVAFTLDATATKLFADYTRDHVGDFFAVALDGIVLTAPSINEPITSGSGQITMGAATADPTGEMNRLVTLLRSGSLPVTLRLETGSPSPSP